MEQHHERSEAFWQPGAQSGSNRETAQVEKSRGGDTDEKKNGTAEKDKR
jgi:hypothetical protein